MAIGGATLRMTGMSGMDVQSMVTQMMRAENMKMDSLKQQSTLLSWKQDAYRDIANKLRVFSDSFLSYTTSGASNFRSTGMFNIKKNSVTNSATGAALNGITIKSSGSSKPETHNLKVLAFAEKDSYVGKSVSSGITTSSGSDIDLGNIKAGDSIKVTLDGVSKTISFTNKDLYGVDDISGLSSSDIDAGKFAEAVSLQLEKAFGKDKLSAANGGGEKAKVSLTYDDNSKKFSFNSTAGHTLAVANASSNADRIASQVVKAESLKNIDNLNFDIKVNDKLISIRNLNLSGAENHDDAAKLLQAEINGLINDPSTPVEETMEISITATEQGMFVFDVSGTNSTVELSNADLLTEGQDLSAIGLPLGTNSLVLSDRDVLSSFGIESGATNTKTTSLTLGEIYKPDQDLVENDFYYDTSLVKLEINGVSFEFDTETTVQDMMKTINSSKANVTMSYDNLAGAFKISSKTIGQTSKIDFEGVDKDFFRDTLGFTDDNNITKASDAIVVINGVQTSRTSNTFDVGGYTITLDPTSSEILSKDDSDVNIKLRSENDVDAVLENIKKFVSEYNTLIASLQGAVVESRPKTSSRTYYEPLTDEERASMSENDIKLWEEKAKTGLLNRDPTVTKIASDLRSWMFEKVDVGNGKSLSLYEIGISSESYRDRGILTIDEGVLRKALEENMESISTMFTKTSSLTPTTKDRTGRFRSEGLGERLNDLINDAIRTSFDSNGNRGSLVTIAGVKDSASEINNTIYNQLKDQTEKMDRLQVLLNSKEDAYYKAFGAMESAMQKNNQQTSWLSSQFS